MTGTYQKLTISITSKPKNTISKHTISKHTISKHTSKPKLFSLVIRWDRDEGRKAPMFII